MVSTTTTVTFLPACVLSVCLTGIKAVPTEIKSFKYGGEESEYEGYVNNIKKFLKCKLVLYS